MLVLLIYINCGIIANLKWVFSSRTALTEEFLHKSGLNVLKHFLYSTYSVIWQWHDELPAVCEECVDILEEMWKEIFTNWFRFTEMWIAYDGKYDLKFQKWLSERTIRMLKHSCYHFKSTYLYLVRHIYDVHFRFSFSFTL